MKTVLSVIITFCLIFLLSVTPCLAEERTITQYGLSIGYNSIIPIGVLERENINNFAWGFLIGVCPVPEISLIFSGDMRFFNEDSGDRSYERLLFVTYGPFLPIQYRFSATYGYEWSLKEGAVLLMLEGGLGVDYHHDNAEIIPVIGIGFGLKKQ